MLPRSLTTARLSLRLLEPADAAFYTSLYTDPDVMRHIGAVLDPALAARSAQRAVSLNAEPGWRRRFWVIRRPQASSPLGLLALSRVAGRPAEAEIGAMLLPHAQGCGHAAEAIRALVACAFGADTGIERLRTRHHPGNAMATGLMRKLGFRLAHRADATDACIWQLDRNRWAALAAPPRRPIESTGGQPALPGERIEMEQQQGSLACVGIGMMLGAHISPRARSHIDQADVVFALVSDPIVELWLQEMRADLRSLQPLYAEGKSRNATYREMVDAMLVEVRRGRNVVGVFYGHPGVFALVPHKAIAQARQEGYRAVMEPGISAEDCLYADLGIDPGRFGCQHYEASQFMFYRRRVDPAAYLVLWQIGIAGDRSYARFDTGAEYRKVLLEVLGRHYPLDHPVIVYEAATLPISDPRTETVTLAELPSIELSLQSTLVIPPSEPLQADGDIIRRLAELDAQQECGPVATSRAEMDASGV
jgi:RimJ/RimL family protein N-acetyltransferase/precorrin-6B methylase 1